MKLNITPQGQLAGGDVNSLFNCVPTCLAMAIQYLTGKPVTGAELKGLVYGSKYTGTTAAAAYINECARRGVKLWSIGGDGLVLVKAIRTMLRRGDPVIITEPDPYSSNPNFSHVVLMFAMDETAAGTLSAMDPFSQGGHVVTHTDAEWAQLFLF